MTPEEYAAINEREHAEIKDAIDKLTDSILGNGQDGIKVQVDRNTNDVSDLNFWFRRTAIGIFGIIAAVIVAGIVLAL